MDACASYNRYMDSHNGSKCYSITYHAVKPNPEGAGNCWLKAERDIRGRAKKVTDSAVVVEL